MMMYCSSQLQCTTVCVMHVTAVTEGEIEQDIVQFNAHVTPAKTSLNLPAGLVWVEATRGLTTAINPLDKDAEKQNLSGVAPRYASNTLEQYLLSSGASLILSTHLSSENMHVIPVLVILFMFGRLTFALGYKYYHAHRAFGHMITAFPTVYFMCIVYTASPGITSVYSNRRHV